MKITAASLHPYRLPLHAEWATAAGGFAQREGWLLRLATDCGRHAHGDCAPLPASGTESMETAATALRVLTKSLPGREVSTALATLAADNAPAARCAVECALLDLLAQAANRPLAKYLNSDYGSSSVALNAALGSLSLLDGRDIDSACEQGFSVLKLKVGIQGIEQELTHLRRLAAHLPAGVLFRLDANRAWREADAERFLNGCAGLPIEMIEEPLAVPLPDILRRLQTNCSFALALDESWSNSWPNSWPDFNSEDFFSDPPLRRLVLKPPRLGGLLPALALARRASAAGMLCIVTSSVDSACGVLAAAHLAGALDNGLAHGLATSSWLAADTGEAPVIAGGRLQLPDAAGLGFVAGADFAP